MNSKQDRRWSSVGSLLLGFVLSVTSMTVAQAQDRTASRAVPATFEALRLDQPSQVQTMPGVVDTLSLPRSEAGGREQVIVRLSLPAAARVSNNNPSARLSQKLEIEQEQDAFVRRLDKMAPGATVIARTQMVLNAVFVEVDASNLPALLEDHAVTRVAAVANYELDLTETVPYIGGSAVQAQGVDGTSIRVAVLDSGIDYTHANMGGPGTTAAYEAAWGTFVGDPAQTTRDGLFPTDKVVDGYDFVGETWVPDGILLPDPDPIDFEGHGSHVADIIGGTNGVAPDVDLYAVKVCSAISSSCSGVALIQGMDFAADPNGDGNTKDRVDIINMSLGSLYGQPFDDDLALAVENASKLGILTVASAGNSADKPYITGTPAAAPSALSVAQTNVPSAFAPQFDATAPAAIAGTYDAVFQTWSVPLGEVIEAPLIYGDGAGGNLNGCAPFAGDLSGKIVLVDRGACNFTLKISNISQASGRIGIIGLVAPGAPFSGGDGGDRPIDIPGYMISQADSNALKSGLPDTVVRFDPNQGFPLIGTMVGSSSRGPSNQFQQIKPEIGAPGASVSMNVGSGTGEGAFGGTSGAAPMVAGSAALLLDAVCDTDDDSDSDSDKGKKNKGHKCPKPAITKARLMNTGETDIDIDPFLGKAEITRIGGGEVRVDKALGANAVAWDKETGQGGLSFGFVDVADNTVTLTKKVRVMGLGSFDNDGDSDSDSDKNDKVTYTITPTFRFADDAANGAVSVSTSKQKVTVKRNSKKNFKVTMTIDGSLLPGNFMNSGSQGANGAALTANEYDGYLLLTGDNGDEIHLPWQVLPRKAARVEAPDTFAAGGETILLNNTGVGDAQVDGFALIATSPDQPRGGLGEQSPNPDLRAVGVTTIPIGPGFELFPGAPCDFLWVFSVNTWERQSHLAPVVNQLDMDIDQDGDVDYFVYNFASGFTFSDGRQVTWVEDANTGLASAYFFTEHATNTGNTVLFFCSGQVGLDWNDLAVFGAGTNVDLTVSAFDVYFGSPGDSIGGLTVTPYGEQYFPDVTDNIPGNSSATVDVFDFGPWPGNSPELGVLLNTNGDRGDGARGGATEDTEALLILAE